MWLSKVGAGSCKFRAVSISASAEKKDALRPNAESGKAVAVPRESGKVQVLQL